jgi:hypothetical protein
MKAKLKSLYDYDTITAENDCHWLLKEVKSVTLQYDQNGNTYISLADAKASFYKCQQRYGQSATDYLDQIRGRIDTIKYHGGTVAESVLLPSAKNSYGSGRTLTKRAAVARDKTFGIALLCGADPTRYGALIAEHSNQFAMGADSYPVHMTAAYSLLVSQPIPPLKQTQFRLRWHKQHIPKRCLFLQHQRPQSCSEANTYLPFQ